MAWIEQDAFKSTFRQAVEANENEIQMAFDAAEDELIDLLGAAYITDAKLETPTDTTGRSERIIRAHSYLALSVHLMNIREVEQEQDAGSPADSTTITNRYRKITELQSAANEWRERAMKAIGSYLTVETVEEQKPPQNYTRNIPISYGF
jgi:hypothetical protein